MSKTLHVPTLAQRLTRIPSDRLYVRLDVARTVYASATTRDLREKTEAEIHAIRAEIRRRGLPPSEEAAA